MKLNILVAFVVVTVNFGPQTEAIMEEKILQFFEEIRNRMCYPLFGYPALDPLQIKHAHYSIDNKYVLNFTCSITDFSLIGLSDFNVTNLKISTLPLRRSNFTVVLPLTSVKTLYIARGSLADLVYLNGNDKASGHVEDVKVSISWLLKTGFSVGIRDLKIEISIGNLFVNIENLMEEQRLNDFLYALINEMGVELLNDIWLEAQEKGAIRYLETVINRFLENYTLSDILEIVAIISDGGCPPFEGIPNDCKTNVCNIVF